MISAISGLDSAEFDALAQDALRTDDFASLLSRVGALSEAHDHLRHRTHDNLNSLLVVALIICQRIKEDAASFNTFAADDFWHSKKPSRQRTMLAAVQFVLRPETTSERKLVSKYARALREFDERGVRPENLPEAIRQTPGGLSAAAQLSAKRHRPVVPPPGAQPAAASPVQPTPQGTARAAGVSCVEASDLHQSRSPAQGNNWPLSVPHDLAARLTAWREKGAARLFDGRFRFREGCIELIAARAVVRSQSAVRLVTVRSTIVERYVLGSKRSPRTPNSRPK
jgi:hypothetical protein